MLATALRRRCAPACLRLALCLALCLTPCLALDPAASHAAAGEAIQPARDTASVEAESCAAAIDDDEVRPYTSALRRLFADSFAEGDGVPSEAALRTGAWRCMDRHLVGCLADAGRPCGKISTMLRNPVADAFCRDKPGDAAVPPAASGDASVYDWRCDRGRAVIGGRRYEVDPRGFAVGAWRRLD